jgi:hypothetical protein
MECIRLVQSVPGIFEVQEIEKEKKKPNPKKDREDIEV